MNAQALHSTGFRLARLGVLLAFSVAGASAQGLAALAPEIPEALERTGTDDAKLQRERFGDLALVAGRPWLSAAPGELASIWRDVQWVVPGAAMRFQRGFCVATKCQGSDYLVRYNGDAKQLEFLEQGSVQYTGRIQEDGSVRLMGTGLVGVLTAETLRFDAAANVLYAEKHELRPATAAQLSAATHGFVPEPAPAAQPSPEADLRAELAAMKAQVEALTKQVEKQQASAPAEQAPKLTPAETREAERRAQREAKAKAAEDKRLAAEARAREDAQRRAEAKARAQREAEARAAEARRLAEERRAAAEEHKRAAAEAKAAEARRVAEAERAKQEARKAAEAERAAAAQRQAEMARAPRPSPEPVVAKAPPAPAAPAADGQYTTSTGYTLNVEFRGDTLVVKEPNKESPYRKTGPNFYEFTNPTNGIAYCMRVIDSSTLEACKPGQAPGMGTRLTLASGGAGGASVPSGERTRLERIARGYAERAQSEPADAQAWSFCSLAALSRANGGGQAQLVQAASALKSISTTSANPCPDAIPQATWAAQ